MPGRLGFVENNLAALGAGFWTTGWLAVAITVKCLVMSGLFVRLARTFTQITFAFWITHR
jgi:hypothetical protein